MKQLFSLLLTFVVGAIASYGQIVGDWSGALKVTGTELPLVFHFGSDGNCTLDSPDQMAEGIPAELLYNRNDSVAVDIRVLGASYRGRVSNDLLKGVFRQRGMAFPLDLKRGVVVKNRPQTPQPPYPYTTEELTFTNTADGAMLTGTLTIPENFDGSKLVVMISGSGQQNRDEELFDHKPFAVLADALARNGIASYRYDDRGVGGSTGLRMDLTTADFRDDALAAVRMLRNKGVAEKIGILGHSEGGLIAYMIAGENPDEVDFIVSMAGTAVKGEKILVSQIVKMAQLEGYEMSEEDAVKHVASQASQPWMKYFLDYDPAKAIAKIKCPVFAANGSKDVQVIAEENIPMLQNLLPTNPNSEIKVYEGLNHLFQHAESGMPTEYGVIEETISSEFISDVITWLKSL